MTYILAGEKKVSKETLTVFIADHPCFAMTYILAGEEKVSKETLRDRYS